MILDCADTNRQALLDRATDDVVEMGGFFIFPFLFLIFDALDSLFVASVDLISRVFLF